MPCRRLLLALTASALAAQEGPRPDEDALALLDTPVKVAASKALSTRTAPGIVSLISREEILASGAADLLEVLRLVPGFDFASDVQGVVGPAVRGNWAFEGKVLLLVDGHELNETRFGTLAFGHHFPVDPIQRIEIIRGPGSAMHGGFAELAVVNVITRQGADLMGFAGSVSYGRSTRAEVYRQWNAAYGTVQGETTWSASATVGEGFRSEAPWRSFGRVRELRGQSGLRSGLFSVAMEHGGFSLRLLHDDHDLDDFTWYHSDLGPSPMRFRGTYAEVRQELRWGTSLRVTPLVRFKRQEPWYYPDDLEGGKRTTERTTVGVQASWDPNRDLSIQLGSEAWQDVGRAPRSQAWADGGTRVHYASHAMHAQALWSAPFALVTVGARYDHNSQFGSSFVPRLALTKAGPIFHLKLLASRAFRAPAIENLQLNPGVVPERSSTLELEVGAKLGRGYLALNLFDIAIHHPIVYQYDAVSNAQTYFNYPRTGTRGFELDFQVRGEWGSIRTALTVSQAHQNQVPDFVVPGEARHMVGLANLKATLLGEFRLGSGWSFAPSALFMGRRFTFESEGVPVHQAPAALIHAALHRDLSPRRLQLTVGVRNLTGANLGFPKAYQGTDGDTYPGAPRTFFVRLSGRF